MKLHRQNLRILADYSDSLPDGLMFLPIEDMEGYIDWDVFYGFEGGDQVQLENGIVIRKDDEGLSLDHIAKFLEETE